MKLVQKRFELLHELASQSDRDRFAREPEFSTTGGGCNKRGGCGGSRVWWCGIKVVLAKAVGGTIVTPARFRGSRPAGRPSPHVPPESGLQQPSDAALCPRTLAARQAACPWRFISCVRHVSVGGLNQSYGTNLSDVWHLGRHVCRPDFKGGEGV